jgi:alanine transaminase
MQLQRQLLQSGHGLPFDNIVFCNIGNPQSLGQVPITFFRQVLALLDYPDLLSHPAISAFPPDAVERAKIYLKGVPGGLGAYSESQGVLCVREEVARFITARDGHAASPENIFLTDGASPAVQMLIRALVRSEEDTIMIPIPQVTTCAVVWCEWC